MVRLRVQSFVPLQQLRDEFDRVLKSFIGDRPQWASRKPAAPTGFPALNMWEEADALKVEAELPGMKSEDLDISVQGGELILQGKMAAACDASTYHRHERASGDFRRVVRLPVDVATDKVEATLRDGILQITLPKAAAAMPHKINVTSA
ncbi:MAG: Hsp20/alpha crystallin family protein [Planctomycetia bacterium]|nr:Hsp20/alpha crystallin family protein [Planctomycetia bacterium]